MIAVISFVIVFILFPVSFIIILTHKKSILKSDVFERHWGELYSDTKIETIG